MHPQSFLYEETKVQQHTFSDKILVKPVRKQYGGFWRVIEYFYEFWLLTTASIALASICVSKLVRRHSLEHFACITRILSSIRMENLVAISMSASKEYVRKSVTISEVFLALASTDSCCETTKYSAKSLVCYYSFTIIIHLWYITRFFWNISNDKFNCVIPMEMITATKADIRIFLANLRSIEVIRWQLNIGITELDVNTKKETLYRSNCKPLNISY